MSRSSTSATAPLSAVAGPVPGGEPAGGRGTANQPCAGVGQDFGWALGMVFRALLKAANAAAGDIPGGQRGFQVLTAVTDGGPGTQLALAQQLGVDRTVLTYLLDDLEGAQLIERQPDPADRRARRVVITDTGRARRDELLARMDQAEQHVLGSLDDDERAALRRALYKAAAGLGDGSIRDLCGVVQDVGAGDC